MSEYIENAKRSLIEWVNSIDEKTFNSHYKSLQHYMKSNNKVTEINNVTVYRVGIKCQYEDGGWDAIMLDNDNLLINAKNTLNKAITIEINEFREGIYEAWDAYLSNHITRKVYEEIKREKDEYKNKLYDLIDKIKMISSKDDLEKLNGVEVGMFNVILISKDKILG